MKQALNRISSLSSDNVSEFHLTKMQIYDIFKVDILLHTTVTLPII